ncbi:MAG: hypothetical protein AB9866_19870 [Syntrophobacteraceae bacterium]
MKLDKRRLVGPEETPLWILEKVILPLVDTDATLFWDFTQVMVGQSLDSCGHQL